jgi:5-methylcytosine-specific restriction endonuclease McrA
VPIHFDERSRYPADWKAISLAIRVGRAKGRCEWCGAVNGQPHPVTGSKVVLTVAHLDHCPEHNEPQNLAALCQRCHNGYDAAKRHSNRKRRQEKRRGQRRLWGEE